MNWPDHPWAGNEYGHACQDCDPHGDWWCDRVAHNLGEEQRALNLLNAMKRCNPSIGYHATPHVGCILR